MKCKVQPTHPPAPSYPSISDMCSHRLPPSWPPHTSHGFPICLGLQSSACLSTPLSPLSSSCNSVLIPHYLNLREFVFTPPPPPPAFNFPHEAIPLTLPLSQKQRATMTRRRRCLCALLPPPCSITRPLLQVHPSPVPPPLLHTYMSVSPPPLYWKGTQRRVTTVIP